jgi:hypothetical protein
VITDAIVSALLGSLVALVSLLPSWTPPTADAAGHTFFIEAVRAVNSIIPLYPVLACAALYLTLLALLRGFDLGVWVFHQFWGSS